MNQIASFTTAMKNLIERIQEAMNGVEENVRVVEIIPVSVHSNRNQRFEASKHEVTRRFESTEEIQTS